MHEREKLWNLIYITAEIGLHLLGDTDFLGCPLPWVTLQVTILSAKERRTEFLGGNVNNSICLAPPTRHRWMNNL